MNFERNKKHVAVSDVHHAILGRSYLTALVRTQMAKKVKGVTMSIMLETPSLSGITIPTYQELALRAIEKYREVRAKPLTEQERGIVFYTGERRESNATVQHLPWAR